jgi:carbonic anhydrase
MITAQEALARLVEGNHRYVNDRHGTRLGTTSGERRALVEGQEPFAVVLGCSDSRVPVEILFDQGLGDLFVIRVAGNVVAPSLIGSVEFAVSKFGTPLVVVLGHSNCGAVQATIEELQLKPESRSPNLARIVDRIKPVALPLLQLEPTPDPEILPGLVTRANVRQSVGQLVAGSEILEGAVRDDGLRIVGAEYDLATGAVDFFDET